MRVAAEALADVEPEPGSGRLTVAALPKALKAASAAERQSILREAMRETVRSEIARERATMARSSTGRGAGAARADGAADGNGNGSASGQAHSAAAQAQQARRSNEVSLQHRQNFSHASSATAPGQDHAPGLNPRPKP